MKTETQNRKKKNVRKTKNIERLLDMSHNTSSLADFALYKF